MTLKIIIDGDEMENVIEVQGLTRKFRRKKGWLKKSEEMITAVDDISFVVKKGEIFGLLGENGAGKTTTIKMLVTLLTPTSGMCNVLGYSTVGEEKKIRKEINYIVGGENGVYRRLSGKENLKYFSNLYHIPSKIADYRIEKYLNLVGLSENSDSLVETYSKGMIQRLQIAKGLINDPQVIFMDEPTIGLDPIGARALRDIICHLKENGKTILLTTHYMHEADELCDRIAIMKNGKILVNEEPENLKKRFSSSGQDNITLEEVYLKLMKD